jgi:protease I
MDSALKGHRVAILAADGVEEVELVELRKALDAAGAVTEIVSLESGEIQTFDHGARAGRHSVGRALQEAGAGDYDALLLPGGAASADALGADSRAVQFVREFMASDKPVAAICHAPSLLVAADAVAGRTLTSSPSLERAIADAGGSWVDEPVRVDGRLITSRQPEDLAEFTAAVVEGFARSIEDRRVDQLSEASFPASDPPPGPSAI